MLTVGLMREATTVVTPADVASDDAVDRLTSGRHERFVVERAKFTERVQRKAAGVASAGQGG